MANPTAPVQVMGRLRSLLGLAPREAASPAVAEAAQPAPPATPPLTSAEVEQSLKARLSKGPLLTLRMDIINKCNLRCIMCHYSDPEISRRKAISVTRDEFSHWFEHIGGHVREIMLSCGDEPLMSRHFADILDAASQFGESQDIGFCTNAMLMTSRNRAAIMRSGVTFIMFSIDGATPATFERIRAGSSYDKVFANIKALRRLKERAATGKPRFIINFVMMRSNIHEALRVVEIGKDLGVDWIDFRHAVPSPPYWTDKTEMLVHFPEVYNFYRAKVVAKAAELNVALVMPDGFPTEKTFESGDAESVDLSHYYSIEPDPETEAVAPPDTAVVRAPRVPGLDLSREFFGRAYCDRPFTEVLIRNQREVLPCAWHQKVLGVLDERTSAKDVYFGEAFSQLRLKMMRWEMDEGCVGCPIKSGHLPTQFAGKDSTPK